MGCLDVGFGFRLDVVMGRKRAVPVESLAKGRTEIWFK